MLYNGASSGFTRYVSPLFSASIAALLGWPLSACELVDGAGSAVDVIPMLVPGWPLSACELVDGVGSVVDVVLTLVLKWPLSACELVDGVGSAVDVVQMLVLQWPLSARELVDGVGSVVDVVLTLVLGWPLSACELVDGVGSAVDVVLTLALQEAVCDASSDDVHAAVVPLLPFTCSKSTQNTPRKGISRVTNCYTVFGPGKRVPKKPL